MNYDKWLTINPIDWYNPYDAMEQDPRQEFEYEDDYEMYVADKFNDEFDSCGETEGASEGES